MLSCYVIILFPSLTLLKIWIVSSVIPLVHNFFIVHVLQWIEVGIYYQSKLLKEWEPNAATVFGTFVNLVIPGIGDLFCIWQSFQWIEVRRYYQSKPFRKSTCREAKHGNGLWHFCTIFGAFTAKPVRPDDSLEILTEGQKRFLRNNVPDVGPLQQVFYIYALHGEDFS